ncbi:MAG: nickel-dependent lactate racemase [Anaerolineales bacterium]|nr:nickel-dependent lactate racemase [Anaerolineales bacterium]
MMLELELAYGQASQRVRIERERLLGVYAPIASVEQSVDEAMVLRKALDNPVGTARLRELVRPGQQVAVVVSDMTRPCPSYKLLPLVMDELNVAGIPDQNITIVVALGLHRPMTREELVKMVGEEIFRRVRVLNHDPEDAVSLGRTSRGTPVEISRLVVEADARICLGNIEFHYFAGYSGGAKAILPGCASRATINANHAMMVRPEAAAGRIDGNPVRADLEEGVAMLAVDFILNVVIGPNHRIDTAVAGHVIEAHRKGCEWVASRGKLVLPRVADVVLAGAGGFPKDINLYQAQKALDNAAYAVRDGGAIVLVAECGEGLGNQTFERWLLEASSPGDILKRIQTEFVLGGHKAAAVAGVLQRAEVFLVSAMPEPLVEMCGMRPYTNVGDALRDALDALGTGAKIAVFPQGGSVLPTVLTASVC